MGELSRMTQYKDKTAKLTQQNKTVKLPTGLFMYPVLMAADIALYNSDIVIVGADQKQHVEFARELIERFNKKYKPVFTVPEPVIAKTGARIMDLLNPEIKMSKSNTNVNGTIFLLDEPAIAASKIMKAKTDSLNIIKYDQVKQPGVSNLITIYHCLTDMPVTDIENKYANANYGVFKKDLAKIVSDFLINFQNNYNKQKNNKEQIFSILAKHANTCINLTMKKMKEVYEAIGINKS
jgi:tryptophanyl-tRNA synthetase